MSGKIQFAASVLWCLVFFGMVALLLLLCGLKLLKLLGADV